MAVRKLVTTIAFAALAAPAFASGVIHNATTERGYTVHPDHASQGKTRDQVLAELTAAQKGPDWALQRWGTPPSNFKPSLSRAEVIAELQRAMKDPRWDSRALYYPDGMN